MDICVSCRGGGRGEEESIDMLLSDGQPDTVERARYHLNASQVAE